MNLARAVSSVDQQNFEKLQNAYNACMDETKLKNDGIAPLLEILQGAMDTFPTNALATDERGLLNIQSKEGFANTLTYLFKLGVSVFVEIGLGPDEKDPDVVVIMVGPGSVGLPAKDYYRDNKVTQKYQNALEQVINNMHESNLSASLAHDVVEFERKLALASPEEEDSNDATKYYNPMSLKDASSLTPDIQLATVIERLAPSDVKVDKVIVMSPDYMRNLTQIISSTPQKVLLTYVLWNVIRSYSSVIEADEIKPWSSFMSELSGIDPDARPERWKTCINHVDGTSAGLGWILSRFYIEKAFSAKAKEFGDQIVMDIKSEFIEKLKVCRLP